MRVIKEHDERRNEILDIAERLFYTKGYQKCTVNDILMEAGIAKGTFYYYFKSKEEVMDAIVLRYNGLIINRAEEILKQNDIDPVEKLLKIFLAMRLNDKVGNEMLDEMHKTENALLHQKTLNNIIMLMSPVLEQIMREGNERKAWNCRYPLQYMQIFLAATLTLTDEGIFELDAASQGKVVTALISMLEKLLELPEGSFMQLFEENWN